MFLFAYATLILTRAEATIRHPRFIKEREYSYTLLGLRKIMVKGGRPYRTSFEIWNDDLGLIGRGEVAPDKPSR